ncbi:MAG: SDR family oxidoreductase [Lachnospiraceae bacterium]|nr:SDR family oxidoreductase [Lachnospiraceae bacterium]
MREKTCLVLGASQGIGKSIVEYLYHKGYGIVAVARNEKRLRSLVASLGENADYIVADLMESEQIETIFQWSEQHAVKYDAMIYCAGISVSEGVQIIDRENLNLTMATNAFGFVECAKHFSRKKYSKDGASIVAISSMSALDCTEGMCAYSMSKAAMNAAVITMSKEFLKRKIRVNAVMPAYVDTEMTIIPEYRNEIIGELEKKQPLGIIKPQEIAALAGYLISEESSSVTGALIPVSGGRKKK